MDLWFSKQNVSTTSTTSKTTNQSFSQDTASQPSFAPKTTFPWGEERCGPRPPFAFITLSTAAEADSLAQEQSIAVAGQVANIRLMSVPSPPFSLKLSFSGALLHRRSAGVTFWEMGHPQSAFGGLGPWNLNKFHPQRFPPVDGLCFRASLFCKESKLREKL